jgi:hypothetical protein
MNTKKSLALVSTSALAAGMAQGGVVYSGALNLQQSWSDASGAVTRQSVKMGISATNDFAFGFENNALKPYVDSRTYVGTDAGGTSGLVSLLTKANRGLPVTASGTMIDSSYAASYPTSSDGRAYMYQDDSQSVAGNWSNTAVTDAYVGIKLNLSGNTSYGWLHFIDNPTASPQRLTLVDWAYQSTPGVGIAAGVVPEPSALALGALGLAGLIALRRRQ